MLATDKYSEEPGGEIVREISEEVTSEFVRNASSPDCGILIRLKNVECLPSNLFEIQVLDLSDTKIEDVPAGVFMLKQLKHLNLSNNLITTLPEEVGQLVVLQVLNVSCNNLATLPSSVQCLKNLRNLDVSSNNLLAIQDELEHLLHIEVLNLSKNKIWDTNILCRSMSSVTHLNLSHNMLERIGNVRSPLCAGKLVYLNLSYNSLEKIPSWLITLCSSLVDLDLSNNYILNGTEDQLNNIEFYNPYNKLLNSLKRFNISNCNLLINESLDFFKRFTNLEVIHIGNETRGPYNLRNFVYDVPSVLLSISTLTELYMPSASITCLPEPISKLTNLKILDLNYNEIAWLNESFCELRSLSKCFLSENKLVVLPSEFGKLESLTELTLNGNCELYALPESFKQLQNLIFLDLYDNHFDDIPNDLFTMSSLKGLDLERNFCNTENLPKLLNYQKLKETMRSHLIDGHRRIDGDKPRLEPDDEISQVSSSWSSDEIEECVQLNISQEGDSRSNISDHTKDDENWSSVDDSEWTPPDTTYAFKLCVEVVHLRRRYNKVTQRRNNFTVEEGQFDDVG